MEKPRSKRKYYYYDQEFDSRTKPRFQNNPNHRRNAGPGPGVRLPKHQDPSTSSPSSTTVSTSYRILCPDVKLDGVVGQSGSIIKAIRQQTGAWINVHQLVPGDEERIIEISDVQRREADGRALGLGSFSAAQEALFMIHERVIESGSVFEEVGGGGKVATRLVVAKANVGSLLGKGGKIIEQMRNETKSQIRVLPRDHNLPRCVATMEEVVQVVGHSDSVKKAIAIISSRLRESQLRHSSPLQGDFDPASRSSGYTFDSGVTSMGYHPQPFHIQDIVFRILCPNHKVYKVMGETEGIVELLRGDVGVDVRVTDLEPESDERIIIVSSDEGPHHDLFPAQEALLHIQSQIVDLGSAEDNIITTKLLVPSYEIKCLEGLDGSLSEMRRLTGANIQILPREQLSLGALRDAVLVQIVGEIIAARSALVELTSRLRSYLFREISFPNEMPPLANSEPDHVGGMSTLEAGSPNRNPDVAYQNLQTATPTWPSKDAEVSCSGSVDQRETDEDASNSHEDPSSGLSRLSVPFVSKSTLEVVIPERAISKLVMGKKLALISEMSGASVTVVEDRPESTQKIIQISGAPEKAEKAQSLLQGFILSVQED